MENKNIGFLANHTTRKTIELGQHDEKFISIIENRVENQRDKEYHLNIRNQALEKFKKKYPEGFVADKDISFLK